jgi:hypothetical protein
MVGIAIEYHSLPRQIALPAWVLNVPHAFLGHLARRAERSAGSGRSFGFVPAARKLYEVVSRRWLSFMRFIAAMVLPLISVAAFAEDGYKIVQYSPKTSARSASFTILHNNIEIKATCRPYYGTRGDCPRLRGKIGTTLTTQEMHFLSTFTLEYNIDGKTCRRDNCEFLAVESEREVEPSPRKFKDRKRECLRTVRLRSRSFRPTLAS